MQYDYPTCIVRYAAVGIQVYTKGGWICEGIARMYGRSLPTRHGWFRISVYGALEGSNGPCSMGYIDHRRVDRMMDRILPVVIVSEEVIAKDLPNLVSFSTPAVTSLSII